VEVSKAWDLVHQQPLVILLHLSMSRYQAGQGQSDVTSQGRCWDLWRSFGLW